MQTEIRNDIDPVDRAVALIDDRALIYGDLITHDTLRDMLQLCEPEAATAADWKAYTLQVLSLVDALRERLLTERKMYLQAVRGRGYRICPPKEQTEVAWQNGMARVKNGLRHIQRGLEHVQREVLDAEEQRRNDEARVRAAGLRRMVNRSDRERRLAALKGKDEA